MRRLTASDDERFGLEFRDRLVGKPELVVLAALEHLHDDAEQAIMRQHPEHGERIFLATGRADAAGCFIATIVTGAAIASGVFSRRLILSFACPAYFPDGNSARYALNASTLFSAIAPFHSNSSSPRRSPDAPDARGTR